MSYINQLKQLSKQQLQQLIDKSSSKTDVLKRIGFSRGNDPRARTYLLNKIEEWDLDISHFLTRERIKNTNRTYTIDELKQAVEKSKSITDVLRYLNLSTVGGNSKTVKRLIEEEQIDTSHFDIQAARNTNRRNVKTKKEVLKEFRFNNFIHKTTLRRWVLKYNILNVECCSICGLSTWLNRPLILEIDHIDGDRNNNDINNLRLLCPNCHSLTPTHRGKNNKKI